jgi:hypothetical protein
LFAQWQQIYQKHGIATFPVCLTKRPDGKWDKVPAVRGWNEMSMRQSRAWSHKFPDYTAFGFQCGPESGLTQVEIDDRRAPQRVADDFMRKHGETPLISTTPSGGLHLWYAHNGEKRDTTKTNWSNIDLLGTGGFSMAPPSFNPDGGYYNIIRGSLDDLQRLPRLHALPRSSYLAANDDLPFVPDGVYDDDANQDGGYADDAEPDDAGPVPCGQRNTTLCRHCLRLAKRCSDLDALIAEAKRFRDERCEHPASVPDAEVIAAAAWAWRIEVLGLNRMGSTRRVAADRHRARPQPRTLPGHAGDAAEGGQPARTRLLHHQHLPQKPALATPGPGRRAQPGDRTRLHRARAQAGAGSCRALPARTCRATRVVAAVGCGGAETHAPPYERVEGPSFS